MIQPLGADVGRQDSVPLTVTSCCPTRRGNDQDVLTRAEELPRCLLVDVVGTRRPWNLTVGRVESRTQRGAWVAVIVSTELRPLSGSEGIAVDERELHHESVIAPGQAGRPEQLSGACASLPRRSRSPWQGVPAGSDLSRRLSERLRSGVRGLEGWGVVGGCSRFEAIVEYGGDGVVVAVSGG
jgi:hypothetical protein